MTLLLGPPGSGKTTLLRALTGRLPPDRYTRVEVRRAAPFAHARSQIHEA
jgi:ABC-type multidrug transport system ATPase subunit